MLNISIKTCLTFCYCLLVRLIGFISSATVVNKSWLIALFLVGVVEANPGPIETPTIPLRDIWFEALHCSLKDRELRKKEFVHGMRPLGNDWINATNLCEEGVLKCSTSSSSPNLVAISPGEIGGKDRYKQGSDNGPEIIKEEFYKVIQWWLYSLVVSLLMMGNQLKRVKKHNARS